MKDLMRKIWASPRGRYHMVMQGLYVLAFFVIWVAPNGWSRPVCALAMVASGVVAHVVGDYASRVRQAEIDLAADAEAMGPAIRRLERGDR